MLSFGQLRSVVQSGDEDAFVWSRLVRLLERFEPAHEGLNAEMLPYLSAHLERASSGWREGSSWWLDFDAGAGQWRVCHPAFKLTNTLTLTARLLRHHPDALARFFAEPERWAHVQRLRLEDGMTGEVVAALVNAPQVMRLSHLEVTGVTDDALEALARWPGLRSLRSLSLTHGRARVSPLCALLDTLREGGGLRELAVTGCLRDPEVAVLACSPALAHVERLCLRHMDLHADSMRVLASSNALEHLRSLEISLNFRSAGLAELQGSAVARSLTKLSLVNNQLGDEIMEPLLKLEQLQELDLSHNMITYRGLCMLAESERMAGLTKLNLGYNKISDRGVVALAQAPALGALKTLNLSANEISDEGVLALSKREDMHALTRLELIYNEPDSSALEVLVRAPLARRLKRLSLSCVDGGGLARALARTPMLSGLRTLKIARTPLKDIGAQALAKASSLERLVELHLPSCRIGEAGAQALASQRVLTSLELLDLSFNQVHAAGAQALLNSPNLEQLGALDLYHNEIGAGLTLGSSLKGLVWLSLLANPLDDGAAVALARCEGLSVLRSLSVGAAARHFSLDGVGGLASARGLVGLKVLRVSERAVSAELADQLTASFRARGGVELFVELEPSPSLIHP